MVQTPGGWSAIRFRVPLGAFILTAAALLFPASVLAQLPSTDDHDPDSGFCVQDLFIETELRTTGAYLPGATIGIRADPPTIRRETPRRLNPHLCTVSSEPVPDGNWSWQIIERPALSTSQLAGTNGTAVTLLLDRAGVYRIRFTACAFGCELELPNHTMLPVVPESREIVVRALTILPPDKLPVLSDQQSAHASSVSTPCPWNPKELLGPVWYTVEPWNGPNDYKLLEGRVLDSRVANGDSVLNHYGMDWDINVSPDPQYRGLLNSRGGPNGAEQSEVDVEWERGYLPEVFRPSRGDRVSAIGYWIYDCPHDAKTEVHPPVLLAVHRPRAIALPESAGFGSNAFVPGIITDIWVNEEAGNTTDGCPSHGLHQQIHPSKPLVDSQGHPIPRCLPASEGFSRSPINRVFEFNIYLPPSPQALMAALGKTAPPVPLYREVHNSDGSPGPEPMIEERAAEDGVTYLKVRIDLRAYTQKTYSRRIVAGWAHAAADNWGARRWNLLVTSLDIIDDADSGPRGDGDWRFWVNRNNGTSEWAKLFDCDACAHGNENFGGTPLQSSIVLFPNQDIVLATSGFEDDWFFADTIAPVSLRLGQMQVLDGRAIANNGDGKYTMHYRVEPGEAVGPAQLSPSAQARYDAYRLTNSDLTLVPAEAFVVLDAVFNAGFGKPRQSAKRSAEKKQRDGLWPEGMSAKQLRQSMQRAVREKPAKLNVFFQELNRVMQRERGGDRDEDLYQFLKVLKPAVPAALWRTHGLEARLRALSRNRRREE